MEKQYFSYVRVSTAKQGERGVSLQEQQDAILSYARRQGLEIVHSFEEKETAAKRGRPVFNQMLKQLRRGAARGVVIHKIDRSARNLKDWADLGELIDTGVEVHFANESLDLHTRGGRLSADIQAVVASDYIRNLREETKKGFYGRLKQGILPIGAPIGYLDQGGGKAKIPDPATAPLIREAFQLYATGEWSLPKLIDEMFERGLRNKRGGKVTLTGMSTILRNPFYTGVIRLRKTGESFLGIHEAIIDKITFDVVQRVLTGKTVVRTHRHEFAFSRMLRCSHCGKTAMAEIHKGHTYYRCHTRNCETKTLREEAIEQALRQAFARLHLSDEEARYMQAWFSWKNRRRQQDARRALEICNLHLGQIQDRLKRLTDAYLDGAIDRKIMDERRASLVAEQAGIRQQLADLEAGNNAELERLAKYLELARSAENLHKIENVSEKRILVKQLTSNLVIGYNYVAITLNPIAQLIANRSQLSSSTPHRGIPRTFDALLSGLERMFNAMQDGTEKLSR